MAQSPAPGEWGASPSRHGDRPGSPQALLRKAFERAFKRPAPAHVRIDDDWESLMKGTPGAGPARRVASPASARLPRDITLLDLGSPPRATHPSSPGRTSYQPSVGRSRAFGAASPLGGASSVPAWMRDALPSRPVMYFVGPSSLGAVVVDAYGVTVSNDFGFSTFIGGDSIREVELCGEDQVTIHGHPTLTLDVPASIRPTLVEACRMCSAKGDKAATPCTVRERGPAPPQAIGAATPLPRSNGEHPRAVSRSPSQERLAPRTHSPAITASPPSAPVPRQGGKYPTCCAFLLAELGAQPSVWVRPLLEQLLSSIPPQEGCSMLDELDAYLRDSGRAPPQAAQRDAGPPQPNHTFQPAAPQPAVAAFQPVASAQPPAAAFQPVASAQPPAAAFQSVALAQPLTALPPAPTTTTTYTPLQAAPVQTYPSVTAPLPTPAVYASPPPQLPQGYASTGPLPAPAPATYVGPQAAPVALPGAPRPCPSPVCVTPQKRFPPPPLAPPATPPATAGEGQAKAAGLAQAFYHAMKGFGTDEAGVYAAAAQVYDAAEFAAVEAAFAAQHTDLNGGSLRAALADELTAKELSVADGILRPKGVALLLDTQTQAPVAPAPQPQPVAQDRGEATLPQPAQPFPTAQPQTLVPPAQPTSVHQLHPAAAVQTLPAAVPSSPVAASSPVAEAPNDVGLVAVPLQGCPLPSPLAAAVPLPPVQCSGLNVTSCRYMTPPPNQCDVTFTCQPKGLQMAMAPSGVVKGPVMQLLYDGLFRIWLPEFHDSVALPRDGSILTVLSHLRQMCLSSQVAHNIPAELETCINPVTLVRTAPGQAWGLDLGELAPKNGPAVLYLKGHCPGTPAEESGLAQLAGWQLQSVDGAPVSTVAAAVGLLGGANQNLTAVLRFARPKCVVCGVEGRTDGEIRKSGYKCLKCQGTKSGKKAKKAKS